MGVLLSELLVPGWADSGDGREAMIGLRDVTSSAGDAEAFDLPCHKADPETFFSEERAVIALAKSMCGGCPMKSACLEGAISRAEPCGVWGGELFEDGRVIAAKRTVGRPRRITPAFGMFVPEDMANAG